MSDPADRYCSDCAWPYECAAAQSCRRRDMGEVRGFDLAQRPDLTGHSERGEGAGASARAQRAPDNGGEQAGGAAR